ncbi:hypothetical protein [Niabella ginsengisoli]|uniref:Transposase IS200-like domain-containing protein n=1 Tax=Niabella ginsengisoli TaxID=522298 RepID=A0ABS9SF45_9BACT|nr:hypothetical protein [Niabella ginsengisoli]MCH5596981.1 hypothetical protein [Niabella ginsengisoli]
MKKQRLATGCYYHVYNRGNNKENIFKEAENYIYFLKLWNKYIEPVAETFCYCLLPNHFHFFIRMRELQTFEVFKTSKVLTQPNQEQHFSNFFNAYSKAINKAYNRTGSLFQKGFKRKEIINESYYTSIIGYIITNPVRHGLCNSSAEYLYSAYEAILSDKTTLLLRNEVIDWFGCKEAFIDYIRAYESNLPDKYELLK